MARGRASNLQRDRWHLVPMVGWIRSYDRSWLKGDLIAGVAVAALIVPKNLGYAAIAGVPLQNGRPGRATRWHRIGTRGEEREDDSDDHRSAPPRPIVISGSDRIRSSTP